MYFCKLKNCCCFDLNTATIFIAGLELFASIVTIVVNSVTSYTSVTLIVSSAVYGILCLLVIIGVKTENSNCLLPWILVTFISIILMFIGLIFIFVSFFKVPKNYTTTGDEGKMDLTLDFLFLTNLIGLSKFLFLYRIVWNYTNYLTIFTYAYVLHLHIYSVFFYLIWRRYLFETWHTFHSKST